MDTRATVTAASCSILGECPLWSVREQRLYFVDIVAPALKCFDPASGSTHRLAMPSEIGCFGLRQDGGFVLALRDGIYLADANGRLQQRLAANPTDPALSRFNDGRVDAHGNFWAGTIWEPRDAARGKLLRVTPAGDVREMAADVTVSNGLAFSPDGRWLYHSDTRAPAVYRYPLDGYGEIGAREVFAGFAHDGGGRPDGAACDSAGYYWSALFDGGRVVRLHPDDGRIVAEIRLPTPWPTMVAFGGADLKTLYITSSRHNRSAAELARWPLSGRVFTARVHTPGLPEPLFGQPRSTPAA